MQKKLIALAIAGLSSVAFADTASVTIYGVADATFDSINVGDGKAATNNTGVGGYQRISTNSSLIGFKGAESIGNGLTAVFQYESAVGFDNLGSLGASRDSYIGLAGGFGTVAIGNLTGPSRALGAAVDVNSGATGIGANSALLGKLGAGGFAGGLLAGGALAGRLDTTNTGNALQSQLQSACGGASGVTGAPVPTRSSTCTGVFDTRLTNAIAYISPDFSGFKIIAGYVPNENKTASSSPNSSAYDIGAFYANGPIYVGLTTGEAQTKNTVETKPSLVRVAGSYDFGVAKVRALWENTKASTNAAGGSLDLKQVVYGAGVTVPVGSGTILAQYYQAKNTKNAGQDLVDSGAKQLEIGYEHTLSKRTTLKAVYSKIDNNANAAYDYSLNATGNVLAGASVTGFQIGARHTF
jgi:predicted porin